MTGATIDHLWQSTVFTIAVALLTLFFRKNRAQVRYWLWLGASVKFLIPFALLISLGAGLWSALDARKIPVDVPAPAVSQTISEITQPFSGTTAFVPSAPPRHRSIWIPAAIVLWAWGFLSVAWMRFRSWRRVRAMVRASKPIEIPLAVPVRSSPGLAGPGVAGLLHPVLLLPEGILTNLPPSQLEAVLAHELSHIRRRDNLTAAVHMIVEAIFWFHPFVWWIGARMVEERERACDEAVLSLGNEPRDYAEAIVSICRLYRESPLASVCGVTGASLKKRIQAILTLPLGNNLTLRRKLLLAVLALAVVAEPVVLGLLNRQHGVFASSTLRNLSAASPPLAAIETAVVPFIEPIQAIPLWHFSSSTLSAAAQAAPVVTPEEPAATQPISPFPPNTSSRPCPASPPPPIVAGPNMSRYSADRENAMVGANALFDCGDFVGAYPLYLKVLEEYPDDARALIIAAEDAIRAGLIKESVPLLQRAIAHLPQNPRYDRTWELRTLLMQDYIKLGRWQDLETERLDTRKASLAGDPSLPQDKGYEIEEFKTLTGEYVESIEFPTLHGPDKTREEFILLGEKEHCTGFTPHVDLQSPAADRNFSLDLYSAPDSRTRLNSYPDGEPSYQTIRSDVLSALSKGPLVSHDNGKPCGTGPLAGGRMPAVTFHLQKLLGGSPPPLKVSQVLLDGQPIALDTPVAVSGMWMRKITVVLQNNSPKNVVQASIDLVLTDTGTGQVGSPLMALPSDAGVYPENAYLQRDGTKKQIPTGNQGRPINIPRGGNVQFSMSAAADLTQSRAYAIAPIENIELDIRTVYFDDGSKWVAGSYWAPEPPPQVWKAVTPEEEFSQAH